jgi:hypothetical protein
MVRLCAAVTEINHAYSPVRPPFCLDFSKTWELAITTPGLVTDRFLSSTTVQVGVEVTFRR